MRQKAIRRSSFASREIMPVLFLAMLSCVTDYASSIFGTIIVGNQFGNIGLVVVGIVTPLSTFQVFLCDFFCGSAVYLRNLYISRNEPEKSERILGNAILVVTLAGSIITAAMFLFPGIYLSFYTLTPETYALAYSYVRIISPTFLEFIISYFAFELVFRMGAKKMVMLMMVMPNAGVLVLGLIFTRLWGVLGMGYATTAAISVNFILSFIIFYLYRRQLRLRLGFVASEVKELLLHGVSYSQSTFYEPVCSAIIYAYLGAAFGESSMSVFAVIECLTEICTIFTGAGYAAENLLSVYQGEENYNGIRKLLRTAIPVQLILGIAATAAIEIFAAPIAAFMGMEALYRSETILALRIFASTFVFAALYYFFSTYFCSIEKFWSVAVIYFVHYLVAELGLSILLGTLAGITGFYLGLALSMPIALLLTAIINRRIYHMKSVFLLPPEDGQIVSFDYDLNKQDIMDTRDALEQVLREKGISGRTVLRILLTFEEASIMTMEENRHRKYAECTLFFREDALDMVIRDNGRENEIAQPDAAIHSLSGYVLTSLISRFGNTSQINVSGTNRLKFTYQMQE